LIVIKEGSFTFLDPDCRDVEVELTIVGAWAGSGSGGVARPGSREEFRLPAPTDPDVSLSTHPARVTY
jgi:hypothetical protein